jgi:beta-lactamase class D
MRHFKGNYMNQIIAIIALTLTIVTTGCIARHDNVTTFLEQDYSQYLNGINAVVVFYRPATGQYTVSNQVSATIRHSPCSTFKVLSTLMALDCGIVPGVDAKMGYDGTIYEYAAWNSDLTMEEAFKVSCVWYYKKVVAKLSSSYVQDKLSRLSYGNADISAWNSAGHNVFWIESSLQISPVEQVNFLHTVFSGSSGFKPEHVAILKQCMKYDNIDGAVFYCKTGTGRNHDTKHLEAWCVGMIELPNKELVYYAVFAADPTQDIKGPAVRDIARTICKIIIKEL